MCSVLIPTVISGQQYTRTVNNRNANLLSKWYQTKINTWSCLAGFTFLFSKLHIIPTLKLQPTMSLEMKSSLEDGKYLMFWLLSPQIHTCPLLRMATNSGLTWRLKLPLHLTGIKFCHSLHQQTAYYTTWNMSGEQNIYKGKLPHYMPSRHRGEAGVQLHQYPTLVLGGGGWSVPHPDYFTPRKETQSSLYRRLGGLQEMV
jgi:hypothetical protein